MTGSRRRKRISRIADSATAAALLAPCFAGLGYEEVYILHLDADLRLIGLTSRPGEAHGVDLPLRQVIGEALQLGARALVIAHNHPGGDPAPSPADRRATRRLAEIARPLDIRIVDHLVFAARRWISFRAMGLL